MRYKEPMNIPLRLTVLVLAAMLVSGLASLALPRDSSADSGGGCDAEDYDGDSDHERARRAVQCGEAMPLADVLAAVRPHIAGRIIETEFDREDGNWVYELKYIDAQGRLVEIYVDATTGRILKTEGDD